MVKKLVSEGLIMSDEKYFSLGNILAKQGKDIEALKFYEKGLESETAYALKVH
jgi:predicted negative regulator of RcsB-dependent stress response